MVNTTIAIDEQRLEAFSNEYRDQLHKRVTAKPHEYALGDGPYRRTPEQYASEVHSKMMKGITPWATRSGPGAPFHLSDTMKAALRKLGCKPTYKALRAYLRGEN